jgi:hypothetical protein
MNDRVKMRVQGPAKKPVEHPEAINGKCYTIWVKNKMDAAYDVKPFGAPSSGLHDKLQYTVTVDDDLVESGQSVGLSLSVESWSADLPTDQPVGSACIRLTQEGGGDEATAYFDVYFDSSWDDNVLKIDAAGTGTPDRFERADPLFLPCTVWFVSGESSER